MLEIMEIDLNNIFCATSIESKCQTVAEHLSDCLTLDLSYKMLNGSRFGHTNRSDITKTMETGQSHVEKTLS